MKQIHLFFNLVKKDNYLLRYSISAKTRNKGEKYVTPEIFLNIKDNFFYLMKELKSIYPNMKFRAERPFFRCTLTKDEYEKFVEFFGITFECAMEFTISPNGSCGLCPPISVFTGHNEKPQNSIEFVKMVN